MNEVWAIHLDGELLKADCWHKYSKKYGINGKNLYGWRPPKKIYYEQRHAKIAVAHLPDEIKNKVEVVKYVPAQ